MRAALLIILLASICLLHAGADDIPVFPDFDVQKLAGTWYPIQYVLKNIEPEDVLTIDEVLEPSDAGDLVFKIRFIHDGECKTSEINGVHTDQRGVFTITDSPEVIHMMDVDYDNYHFMHVINEDTFSMFLLGRTREASDDVKAKFKDIAASVGFNVNQITAARLADEAFCSGMIGTYCRSADNYGLLFAGSNPTSLAMVTRSLSFHRVMPIMLLSIGKSGFGGIFKECTTTLLAL